MSSIPLLYSLLLLKVFRHLSPNAQLHTVAPGNKCSVRGIKITWSLCGYHSSISCLFYSSACRMYCGVCLIFNNNLTILIKMLVQISIMEHLVILNANQIRWFAFISVAKVHFIGGNKKSFCSIVIVLHELVTAEALLWNSP